MLRGAFRALRTAEVVFGPATDGGYTLVGVSRHAGHGAWQRLFDGIEWGGPDVLAQSLAVANAAGLSVALLEELSDVDRPEDLPVWQAAQRAAARRVSVIVPALNEAATVAAAIRSACGAHEIIVADGGSEDGTTAVAERHGARVLACPRGRAAQMNAGARAAKGDALLFLHADTCLPPGWLDDVRRVLRRRGTVGGAFDLRIDGSGAGLRLIEKGVGVRSRLFQMPYGDQALFVRRDAFGRAGAFPEMPVMEDFVFVRRLRRLGRIGIVPGCARTSARRWVRVGAFRATLIHQAMILGYALGVSARCLAAWYNGRGG